MAGVTIHGSDLSVLILVPISLVALMWFLDRTTIGKTVQACATNPELARISGVSPKWVSTMVWSLAAGLSTLSIMLIAGQVGLGRAWSPTSAPRPSRARSPPP